MHSHLPKSQYYQAFGLAVQPTASVVTAPDNYTTTRTKAANVLPEGSQMRPRDFTSLQRLSRRPGFVFGGTVADLIAGWELSTGGLAEKRRLDLAFRHLPSLRYRLSMSIDWHRSVCSSKVTTDRRCGTSLDSPPLNSQASTPDQDGTNVGVGAAHGILRRDGCSI